jgi:predicted heme/steroid binding protein
MTRTFTSAELAEFDGRDGRPAYVGYAGKVYDLTGSPHFGEGDHYGHQAGEDLTEALDDAPHEDDVFSGLEVVGALSA